MPHTTSTPAKVKTATVLREYKVSAYGYEITVPAGATVSNQTASGPDDNYRFWVGYYNSIIAQFPEYKPTMLLHDLAYRGLLIPEEFCTPWN